MRRYQTWLTVLGLAAVTPSLTEAGPLDFLSGKKPQATSPADNAKVTNQKTAEMIAKSLRDSKLGGYNIEVEYNRGTATLIGSIPNEDLRERAALATKRVPGVRSVDNRLQLMAKADKPASRSNLNPFAKRSEIQQTQYAETAQPAAPSNQDMADRIAQTLRASQFSGEDVELEFQDGIATIGGVVGSPAQKARATALIARVPGVTRVNNKLEVAPTQTAAANDIQPAQFEEQPAQYEALPTQYEAAPQGAVPMGPGAGMMPQGGPTAMYATPGGGINPVIYDQPYLPNHAWPGYAQYPNYAAVTYPKQYSASAWPYIGPFYPYPQVPLGWRAAQLEWDDGYWQLNFKPRTEKWWWFMNPKNW